MGGKDPNALSNDPNGPGTMDRILGILAAGAAGAGGGKPGPVKTIFGKKNPNVKVRKSLNATGSAPGFDPSGAALPGLSAGLPGPPSALSTPSDDMED